MHLPKFACLALLSTLLALAVPSRAEEAAAYVVADSTTGFILEQYRGDKKLQVGSLTKVATAMVVLDWSEASNSDLGQIATVPDATVQLAAGQATGFQPGDRCTLRDLLYAALMQSDNVAALTLADHVGRAIGGAGSPVDNFVAQMNALAKTKGMRNTKFLNPHGLDNLERSVPYSTAADLAKLTSYAMANSAFRFYVSQRERQISWMSGGKKRAYQLKNTNELLGQNGIDGVKTGRTPRAGDCLILSSNRQAEVRQEGRTTYVTPRHLILVVLGSTDRFGEGSALLAQGWQLYDQWAASGRQVQPSKTL